MMKSLGRLVSGLYLMSSLSLALFCLYQSHKVGYDQRGRELAGRINADSGVANPVPSFIPMKPKQIGEGTD